MKETLFILCLRMIAPRNRVGWVLARGHAKVCESSATTSGYPGTSSEEFDEASSLRPNADQTEHDYAALKAAVRKGEITACNEA